MIHKFAALVCVVGLNVGGAVQADGPCSVSGRVIDRAQGSPIIGARVEIEGTGEVSTTNRKGGFLLARLPQTGQILSVSAEGYEIWKMTFERNRLCEDPPLTIELQSAPQGHVEHVIVTATRTPTPIADVPGSLTVLDRSDLQMIPGLTLADALGATTGLRAFSSWGNPLDTSLDVRGFAGAGISSYLLVLLDDSPVNDLDSGLVDWSLVPIERIDRIEIQRGPVSPLYGDTGLGGVVHLFTSPFASSPTSNVSVAGGSAGERREALSYDAPFDHSTYDLSASHRERQGDRDRSRWTDTSLTARARWEVSSRSTLVLSSVSHWLDDQNPGPLSERQVKEDRSQASYPFDGRLQSRHLSTLTFSHEQADGGRLTIGMSQQIKRSDQILTFPLELQSDASLVSSFDVKHQDLGARTTTLDSQLEKPFQWGALHHRITAGMELSAGHLGSRYKEVDAFGNPGALTADGDGSRRVYGGYAQDQIGATRELGFLAGIRYDRFDDEFDERLSSGGKFSSHNDAFSPRLGMTWSYRPGCSLFLLTGAGFRAPTMEQLFDQRQPFGSSISNSHLRPQRAKYYEVGFRQPFAQHGKLELALYRTKIWQEIEFDPATYSYGNIGRSPHQGIELTLSDQLRKRFGLLLNYGLQDATHENGGGPDHQIILVPRHQGSLSAHLVGSRRWSGSLILRATGRQFLDETNQHALPSSSVLDGEVRYRWKGMEVIFSGLNILDSEYSSNGFIIPRLVLLSGPSLDPTIVTYPAPERTYSLALRWTFGGSDQSGVPGRPAGAP
ncbi:MAG: hypothetical protein DMF51_10380 [Acidobacteria bacterium]|nr:MAG: hypothetical protein DMF51_10380 [Acidobacteriota bacterium]